MEHMVVYYTKSPEKICAHLRKTRPGLDLRVAHRQVSSLDTNGMNFQQQIGQVMWYLNFGEKQM
jgi:hypothetical protein